MIRLLPQKAGTLNYLPLNLDNAHRENNNNSSIAAMHSNKSGLKYITDKNVTQIEVITLDTEDMSSDSDEEGYLCVICLEIIPTEEQYEYHHEYGDCESPPQSPMVTRKENLNCSTCHTTFRS